MPISDPRAVVLTVLRRVDRDRAFANLALDAELQAARLSQRDTALATELLYGTLRRRGRLDHALAPLVAKGLESLEPAVLDALRLGALQLLFLRTPTHAAVSATVDAAKQVGLTRAAGLINAVLRRLSREGEPPLPDRTADPLRALTIETALPQWIVIELFDRLGADGAFRFAEALLRPPAAAIRPNLTRTSAAALKERLTAELPEAAIRDGERAPGAILIEGGGSLVRTTAFRDGLFSLQDEAAQLVGLLTGDVQGRRVLDACAAPGGKSCHLAERGAAEVVSLELHPRKAERIGEEAQRLGLTTVKPFAADASGPLPAGVEGPFDVVVLDAPCSGLGTLRRHPELRDRRTQADVTRLAEGQAKLLDALAGHVRVGGTLVYAVCSLTRAEGPTQLQHFLQRQAGRFVAAPLDAPPPGVKDGHLLETWPHEGGLDGFFAARLTRRA